MLEILAKCWSFYSFVGLVGLICWVVLPIGWEHRCHQDLQNLGRDKFGIRTLGSSVSRVQEQCLVESCGSV